MPKTNHRLRARAERSGLFPYNADEAIIFGPVSLKDIDAFSEEVSLELTPYVESVFVDVVTNMHFPWKCVSLILQIRHVTWPRPITLEYPPMPAKRVAALALQTITLAERTPYLDPELLARESFSHVSEVKIRSPR